VLDLAGKRRLLDVGGGPGTYSCLLVKKNPGLTSVSMDLPAVVAIARTIIAGFGLTQQQVEARVGNYHQEAYPAGNDVVLCSGMFHRETAESCRAILRKSFAALEPGGLVVVHDVLANELHTGPAFSMLFGLNMALTATYGTVHSAQEVAAWMAEAGFVETREVPLPPPWPEAVVLGKKP
jgi:cyclopropane fatty-acyl-phospholipid synthase-like methyltransferase